MRLLLDKGARLGPESLCGAASQGHVECVRLLLDRGLPADTRNLRMGLVRRVPRY